MTMFNSHLVYLIGFYIKWTIWHWGESLIWLEVFMAERYYNKERFMIRTHAYGAHEVLIRSYWDILQADISEKLSRQIYSCSPSFFASFSLSILHIMMKGAPFTPTSICPVLKASKASLLGLCFSGFLPTVQNWSFAEQTGTNLERLSAVTEWNVRFWMESHLVCSLKSLPKRLAVFFRP